ncbi:DUF3560 domain-containing protein [Streptomyces sp. E-08]|uniref:DUF3560 domain-containing protein n=1 Tax=Streptomyces sp. E-08 TaxID=3404047 RepID=UPI003CF6C0FE
MPNYVPRKGYQPFAPVSAYVGKVAARGERMWFPLVVDGVLMDAEATDKGEWIVSVQGAHTLASSAPVAKGMVVMRAVTMLRELRKCADATRHVGFGVAYSRKYVIREVESFARECHTCQEPREQFTGNRRLFTYEKGTERTMCATHLARALSYRTVDGRFHEVTTGAVESIGDAQRVMGMRNSLAARAMVALITGEVDAEADATEAREEASAETCATAAEGAAVRAERAAEAAESRGPMDAEGAWADAEAAEGAARDTVTCAGQIPAEREAHAERARSAVDRARAAAQRARHAAEDRQSAADDERCGMAAADEAEAAAAAARDAAAEADRWAAGCPRIGDFPAMLAGWVQDARAAAAEATQVAERAQSAVTSRAAERHPWGVVEWFTVAGACAGDAREAAKYAQQSAKLAAVCRGRADRAAREMVPEVPAPVVTAQRDAEAAEERAAKLREHAERLQGAASEHYGRFAGGQPVLMGHHSAKGALRDRARGDVATRRAMAAAEDARQAEVRARGARAAAELAAVVHGWSRGWEPGDFRVGDVVEVRKRYTASYVVVRVNGKSLTLRNRHTIDDPKCRYDQILSRTRDGRTETDPGQCGAPAAKAPAVPAETAVSLTAPDAEERQEAPIPVAAADVRAAETREQLHAEPAGAGPVVAVAAGAGPGAARGGRGREPLPGAGSGGLVRLPAGGRTGLGHMRAGAGGCGVFRRSGRVTGLQVTGHVTGCVTVAGRLGRWRPARGVAGAGDRVPKRQRSYIS